ncbi:histidine kinase osmosensor [Linnemannia zychae]|nr:histidine kinase osmosensor [Linnemannia zychae]
MALNSDSLAGVTLSISTPHPPLLSTSTKSSLPVPTAASLNIPLANSHRTRSPLSLSSSSESMGSNGGMSSYVGFQPAELSNSHPSSPDSFNSALSSFPFDLPPEPVAAAFAPGFSDPGSIQGLDSSSPESTTLALSALSFSGASRKEEVPCAACIHRCASVAAAVVQGDLSLRLTCDRPACNQTRLATSINQMIEKLSTFTEEVICVAAQGVEGKLGIKANMENEHGIWKEFITHLNTMTEDHMNQVRDIATVCTAVAHGDLSRKITVDVKGETLTLKNTINTMGTREVV